MPPRLAAALLLVALAPAARGDDETAVPKYAEPIVELYKSGKLFDKAQYRAVRAGFVQAFETKNADLLKTAFGKDHADLTAWLDKNVEAKEEFFMAINEERDDVEKAL